MGKGNPTEGSHSQPDNYGYIETTAADARPVAETREAGWAFDITCRECGETVEWAVHNWAKAACRCGWTWEVELVARGHRYVT